MLACGAIIIALPWLLTRSNWDPNWDKPAVAPLWKVQALNGKDNFQSLTFSPDGKLLFSNSTSILRWDASTGKSVSPPKTPLIMRGGTLSPGRTLFAVNAIARQSQVVNTSQQTLVWKQPRQENGSTIYESAGATRKNVRVPLRVGYGVDVYDVSSGRKVVTLPIPNDTVQLQNRNTAARVFFALNGKSVVTSSTRYDSNNNRHWCFRRWALPSGRLLQEKTRIQSSNDVGEDVWIFSPDDMFYNVRLNRDTQNSSAGSLILADEFSFRRIELPIEKRPYSVGDWTHCAFSSDGRFVTAFFQTSVSGTSSDAVDKTIYLWDLGKRQIVWHRREPQLGTQSVAFSPSNNFVAIGGFSSGDGVPGMKSKGQLLLLRVRDGARSMLSEESSQNQLQQSQMAWTESLQRNLRITSTKKSSFLPGDSGPIYALAFSPDGHQLAAGYSSGEIKMWRVPQ